MENPDAPTPSAGASRRTAWRDLVGPVAALTLLAAAAHLVATRRADWQPWLAGLGPWTPVLYVVLWLVLVPAGLPAAALALAAGVLFGPYAGSGLAALGLVLAGALMHTLGVRWLRPRVARLTATQPRLARLEAAAACGGIRMHVLARLSPLNYALVSYTLAAGGAPLRPYLAGLLGALPGLVAYVWLGAAAERSAAGGAGLARGVVALCGSLGLLVLAGWLARVVRRTERPS